MVCRPGLTAADLGMGSALTNVPISAIIKNQKGIDGVLVFRPRPRIVGVRNVFWSQRTKKSRCARSGPNQPQDQSSRFDTPRNSQVPDFLGNVRDVRVDIRRQDNGEDRASAPNTKDFKIAAVSVSLTGLTVPALTSVLSTDHVFNGLTRPCFGWVFDHIGHENTMCIAFAVEPAGIIDLRETGHNPPVFVLLPASCSSGRAKSTACSQRPAVTLSGPSVPRRMRSCNTPPTAPRR